MTIQQIGYFIRLAEELNYTYVARLFFITQPTLSRQIVNLENELNVELFVRKHNTVTLTKEGQHFYNRIKPLYQELTTVIKETQQISEEPEMILIGLQEEQLISKSITRALKRLRDKYPSLQVKILRGTTDHLFGGLTTGKFDLVNMLIYPMKMYSDENLVFYPIQSESTYMVIASDLFDSDKDSVSKKEFQSFLEHYPVILPAIFQDAPGVDPKGYLKANLDLGDDIDFRIIESGTPISLPVQVASQLGISVTNKTNMVSIDPEIKMVEIQDTEDSYEKGVLYRQDNSNNYVKELLRLIKEESKTK